MRDTTMEKTMEMAMEETYSLSKAAEPEPGPEPVRVGEIDDDVGRSLEAVAAPAGKKWTKVILTKDEVDRVLSIPDYTRPFPTLTEELLSDLTSEWGLEYSERFRAHFIRGAEIYRSLRQSVLRGKENIRKQLEEKGYAERFQLVDATDDGDVPAGGDTGDITRNHRAKL